MNLLTYVHLRNIYRSTGVGRVARELTEHLARDPSLSLEILADPQDHAAVIHKVGAPWTDFSYRFFAHETSRQQARWFAFDTPPAEHYWPEVEVVYCTAESYVPTRRARLAVACHDMQLFESGAHHMNSGLLRQRFKWWLLFRKLARKADLFHAISAYSAERMAHYFPQIRSRLHIVPNAVSRGFFAPPTPAGHALLDALRLRDRPYILVPGGLHHRKNAELILAAWPALHARCPDLRLVVANHNSPQYLARAQALAPDLVLAGYQEEPQLAALYAAAECVWFPSRYEGFGMPVLEAMAAGAPVVTSNAAALPEVAGGAAAALLPPDSPGAHVEALAALHHDPARRAQAAALGRQRAALFTWDRSASILAAGLRSLL